MIQNWPRANGDTMASGLLKCQPEDFLVDEIPLVQPSGQGTHLWLEIRKTGANTDWVAGQLARAAGVARREVGYAGMKDRHAVTSQWFSIGTQEAKNTDWQSWDIEGVELLQGQWNERKLQRGALKGNRFGIVLRDIEGDADELESRLQRLAEQGCPNYFGPQRFGRGGSNWQRAVDWLTGGGRMPRHRQSILISAARSYLFNLQLADRVITGDWNRLHAGDVVALDASQSVFVADTLDPELEERCQRFDIHPACWLPGEGGKQPLHQALERCERLLAEYKPVIDALASRRVAGAWRAARVVPETFDWSLDSGSLKVAFTLPAGAYATVVLSELVSFTDASISEPA